MFNDGLNFEFYSFFEKCLINLKSCHYDQKMLILKYISCLLYHFYSSISTEITSTTSRRPPFSPNRPKGIGSLIRDRLNRFNPTKSSSEEITTPTTKKPNRLGGFKTRTTKGPTVQDLLASIPRDDLSSLLPNDFKEEERRPSFSNRYAMIDLHSATECYSLQ